MEEIEFIDEQEILSGFRERMGKVALFDALFELQRKREKDQQGNEVDFMELGMLTLLFFFEQKLMRNQKVGVAELTHYLQKVTSYRYRLSYPQYEEIARTIIHVFRPSHGRRRSFEFYNFETRQEEWIEISILKANHYDSKTMVQYYALDEDGLELVFATKEFYAEFQLSIHQLILRKQLEKGEFQGALRQINEMRVDVDSLQDRMYKLEHEIKRSIVSEDTLRKYSTLLEDIYSRLQREHEEFEELRDFVKETKERIYSDTLQDKQHKAYEYILRIGSELEKVHNEHTGLLQHSADLRNVALNAARESLYLTGINSFNFAQDIGDFIFGSPLPLEALRATVSPFIGLEQHKSWSLLTVFGEQNIVAERETGKRQIVFEELSENDESNIFTRKRNSLFYILMEDLLSMLEGKQQILLSEFINEYRKYEDKHSFLNERMFYDFWLILHHRTPVRARSLGSETLEEINNLDQVFWQLGNRILIIEEHADIIMVSTRYRIQEMKISWGGYANEL